MYNLILHFLPKIKFNNIFTTEKYHIHIVGYVILENFCISVKTFKMFSFLTIIGEHGVNWGGVGYILIDGINKKQL